jgi:hypothetical protein
MGIETNKDMGKKMSHRTILIAAAIVVFLLAVFLIQKAPAALGL